MPEINKWWEKALCAEIDPDLFFESRSGSNAMAKLICTMCEVNAHCLEDALSIPEQVGIAGGLSAKERLAILALKSVQ